MSNISPPEAEDLSLEIQKQGDTAYSLRVKAELDMQIATAKAFPRSLTMFMRDVMSLATVNQQTAEACTYVLPRAGKSLQGPSIRFAEIVAACYGNLRTGARVIHNNGKVVVAQGVVHDLQRNVLHTEEVERRITDKNGKTYNEDMQVVTGRAACAIAFRNAVFKVVPAALVEEVYLKVKEVARGDAQTLPQRRKSRLDYFTKLGVKESRICEVLGVKGVDDIDLDKLVDLQGMVNAHKTGELQLEELFPPPDAKARGDKATAAAAAKLKHAGGGAAGVQATTSQLETDLKSDAQPLEG